MCDCRVIVLYPFCQSQNLSVSVHIRQSAGDLDVLNESIIQV